MNRKQRFWPKSPMASSATAGPRTGASSVVSRRRFLSLRLICAAAKAAFGRITASAAATRVVRGQKSRLLLLPWLSIICKLAWGAISQTNAHKQRKKYCHLGILLSSVKTCTCEAQQPMHGWQVFIGGLYSRWVPIRTVKTNNGHLYEQSVWSAASELCQKGRNEKKCAILWWYALYVNKLVCKNTLQAKFQ